MDPRRASRTRRLQREILVADQKTKPTFIGLMELPGASMESENFAIRGSIPLAGLYAERTRRRPTERFCPLMLYVYTV